MWFWGAVLGMFLGASLHGWTGAFWGAVIGWLAALLLGNKGKSAEAQVKAGDTEVRLAQVQKSMEDIQARLVRLERNAPSPTASVGAAPDVVSVPASTVNDVAGTVQPVAGIATPPPLPVPAGAAPFGLEVVKTTPPAIGSQSVDASRLEVALDAPELGSEPDAAAGASATSPQASKPLHARPTVPPARGTEPEGPGFVERMLEGNLVAKLGVIILFFGVGFLLKFAYDRGMFPPELRLIAVAAAGAVMFLIGYRLMETRRNYALVMMGGAMGLLYLDVFFALKTFGLIGAPVGFLLFAALGIATIFLAVRMDARAFAALGLTGAFLAPILASTGSGNHMLLFSYYLLLNLVILGASWFKSWRELNFIGFLFTFAIAIFWGRSSYQPEHFSTVEPFLIAFFLLYLAIPILFASRQPPELKGLVDGTLVFGMPMSAAMLQAALTRDMSDYVLAWSALGAALVYAGLAWTLWNREKMRLLAEAHLALAIVFGTVAPYFAFQGYPTFAFWTLEGAAIFWMGCRQKSVLARAFALCLQVGAAGYFWWVTHELAYTQPWWNDRVVGCGLIAVATLFTAWFMHRFEADITPIEADMQVPVIAWGGVWLLLGVYLGTWQQWAGTSTRLAALLMIAAAVFTLFEWIGSMLDWRQLRLTSRVHIALAAVAALWWFNTSAPLHPLAAEGVFAWPLSFIAYFYVLHRQRQAGIENDRGWRYTAAWILMMLLASWEALLRYDQREYGWVFAIGVAGLIASALRFRLREFVANDDGEDSVKPTPLRWSNLPMLWSLVWWFAGIHGVIDSQSAAKHHLSLHLVAAALSILVFELLGRALTWTALRRTQLLLTALMLAAALHLAGHDVNPFRNAQFLAWILAFVVGDLVLRWQEREGVALSPAIQLMLLFALAIWLIAYEAAWRADMAGLSLSWQFAGAGLAVALGLAIATLGIARQWWPFATHETAFRSWAVTPLLVVTLVWTLFANAIGDGTATPLPFVPLLNPLDHAQLALFAAGIWAMNRTMSDDSPDTDSRRVFQLMFAAAAFFWVNAALLRTVHHWADVPFELQALLDSRIAQAALSLLWTSTALVMMLAAGRRQARPLWMLGAALLGVVVLKLFVNDIGTSGTERVVSFIGVGVLLMVIGYVAPVPPRVTTEPSLRADDGQQAQKLQ